MIAIGCDHGALELKEQLIEHLKKRGVECKDYGTYTKDSCDYPVYAKKVAEAILSGECEEGILLCGTGDLSGWQGYLREADQGLYGEAVGARLQGSSVFYY